MTYRAHVEFDPMMAGVRIAVYEPREAGTSTRVLHWPTPVVVTNSEPGVDAPPEAWLRIRDDAARALYEALASYFGGAGHDTRALRKDYDAERARVDKLITFATTGERE